MGLAERICEQQTAECAWCQRTFSFVRRQRSGRRRAYAWRARKSKFCSWSCYRAFMNDRRCELRAKPRPAQGHLLNGKLTDDEARFAAENASEMTGNEIQRPRLRSQCADGPRPCPWVSCRYNLYLDVTPTGAIRVNLPIAVDEMRESCALDFDERPQLHQQIGDLFGLSRQRVQQIEERSIAQLAKRNAR